MATPDPEWYVCPHCPAVVGVPKGKHPEGMYCGQQHPDGEPHGKMRGPFPGPYDAWRKVWEDAPEPEAPIEPFPV